MSTIVGRESELATIEAFLEGCRSRPGALIVEGEPGAGKTTLWQAALDRAGDDTMVIACRPSEAEITYSYGSLGDLLDGAGDSFLDDLPTPQRRALEAALLLDVVDDRPGDHRAVGAGTLTILKALGARRPVVVAVDDIQWLDRASARALGFALRRLSAEPIALLAARRTEQTVPLLILEAALRERSIARVKLGPLSVGALGRVIEDKLDVRFPRTTMLRIRDVSGGNPLHALELARALAESGLPPGQGEPLPVPESLQALLLQRVRRLPSATREALLLASLASPPSEETLRRAFGARWDRAVRRLEDSGIAKRFERVIRFSHPLLASTVVAAATPEARRGAHLRLSEVVGDDEQRARHLALAATGPDGAVAATLENASRSATKRGAPDAAAELAELAFSLTPSERGVERCRRAILAGDARFAIGDFDAAAARFKEAEMVAPEGRDHADALLHIGRMRIYQGDSGEANRILRQALAEASTDDALGAVINADLAFVSASAGTTQATLEYAEAAVALAEAAGERHTLGDALAQAAAARFVQGGGLGKEKIERALENESWQTYRATGRASQVAALLLSWADEFDEARTILERCEREITDRGLEPMLPFVWYLLSELDCWTGAWEQGIARATEADRLAAEMDEGALRAFTSYAVALLASHLGRVEDARAASKWGMDLARERGSPVLFAMNSSVRGFVEASLGRQERAVAILGPLVELGRAAGLEEPAPLWFLPELIEALLATGDVQSAESLTGWLDERAQAIDRPRGLAGAARCRALIAAAGGHTDEALDYCEQAIAQIVRVAVPFDSARTHLIRGQIARRGRKWGIARESLDTAYEAFESLGAVLWLERTRDERSRIGGRAAPPRELTPSEQRVAELVAEGRSNKDVAEALFLSPRTVSATLSRVYRKLGVSSRTELSARLRQHGRT